MKLKVKYFGMIAEWANTGKELLAVGGSTVDGLRTVLAKKIPQLRSVSYQIAVNQKIATGETTLNENDEVAILPPFAGG